MGEPGGSASAREEGGLKFIILSGDLGGVPWPPARRKEGYIPFLVWASQADRRSARSHARKARKFGARNLPITSRCIAKIVRMAEMIMRGYSGSRGAISGQKNA